MADTQDANSKLRRACERRVAAMKQAQADYIGDWRDVSDYVDPMRGRFDDARNRPRKRNRSKVINSSATEALRVMSAGMMSHMTSKARPWFRVAAPDPNLAESFAVRVWLDEVAQRIRDTLAASNFYKAMPVFYTEDAMFGSAAMLVLEDPREVVRFYPLTCGTYALGLDDQQRVDSLWRQYTKTARQLEQRYGLKHLPMSVRNALDNNPDQPYTVQSLIEPNPDARPGVGPLAVQAPRFRPYREVVWINTGTSDGTGILDIGGHYEAPFVAARWAPVAEDIYSTSPAIDSLGDIKQLQYLEGEKLRLMEELSDPTLLVPDSLRNQGGVRLRKGGQVYLPAATPVGAKIETVYTPEPRALQQVREEIAQIEGRIQRNFHRQLFLMLDSLGDQTGRTATEIAERKEEKAAVLGPTLEAITDEVLDPTIIRVFRLLERAGRIPPPPPELADVPLKIEYTSILAQAAKANGTSTIERGAEFVGRMAAVFGQEVLDKFNADQAIDDYTNAIGMPAAAIRDDDTVAQIRSQRAQAAQAQQMAQQMAQMARPLSDVAGAIKTAAETVPQEGSLVEGLAGALGGGA